MKRLRGITVIVILTLSDSKSIKCCEIMILVTAVLLSLLRHKLSPRVKVGYFFTAFVLLSLQLIQPQNLERKDSFIRPMQKYKVN